MKNIISIIFGVFGAAVLILISALSLSSTETIDEQINMATLIATPENAVTIAPEQDINDLPFEDNMNLYQYDDPGSVVYMYVTVRKGNSSDNTHHTWEEVNDFSKWYYTNFELVDAGMAEAIVQIGDEEGPLPGELGYGAVVPNGTIGIRGASTSRAPQKSYKIELFQGAGEWRGQSTFALNKHIYDLSRMRNILCFDLMAEIPDMVSLRTQFVRLYVKDETSDPANRDFVDYGLFTQIEQPNRRFLKNHLLDADGQLYKANSFEFFRYPENLRLVDDPLYNQDAFYSIMETKSSKDHTKLLQMLDDVNDLSIPIEQTFEKYFNPDNYFTWMAFNILIGNIDTQSQNFYLYSPKSSDTWYFIPWDYDSALSRQNREYLEKTPYEYYEFGIANYWGVVLHKRVLKVDKYRDALTEKIEELNVFLSTEKIDSMVSVYRPVIEEYLSRLPDSYYHSETEEQFDFYLSSISSEIDENYRLYYESLEYPMPFFLGTPKIVEDQLYFNWDTSYDIDAENILYTFTIGRDWEFNDVVFETTLTNLNYITVDMLEPGTYFWRVTALNESGYTMYPFDYYFDVDEQQRPGLKYLYISDDYEIFEK